MTSEVEAEKDPVKRIGKILGPGFITGASDDDPSGIGTYAVAGASGIFAPGLKDPALIRQFCERSPLPVNIMVIADTPSNNEMADLGVGRISYGPGPYREMMENLKNSALKVFS